MRLLIVDMEGTGLAFALRCQKAGHEVRLWVDPGYSPKIGDGFKGITKVENWVGSVKWADLVFPTGNHQFMPKLDAIRRIGIKVFGPTQESASLEIDRNKGMKFLEKHGIRVPEYEEFKTLEAARDHVKKTERRYVFKTLGDADDKSLSYCSKSPADMIARIDRWIMLKLNPKGPVMLQEFIDGTEFAVSTWVGKNGFIGKFNENFEHKKLLSGNAGPNCGESGTVQKYCMGSILGDEMLKPLEESLVKMGHTGDIDVNCIIDDQGQAFPLEFTCRPGWPAFNIMLVENDGDPVQWMYDACKGKDSTEFNLDIACGVVLAQPDYPYSKLTKKETDGIPIYGITAKNSQYIHPQSVRMQSQPVMDGDSVKDKDIWTTCGDYLAVITGTGDTVKQATARAYRTLKQIQVPDMIYRDDIGEKLEEEIETLHNFGYADEFTYE
jgi:phosphoribosylamine---glycine ligase